MKITKSSRLLAMSHPVATAISGGPVVVTLLLLLFYSTVSIAVPNPQERIDYWQRNYTELTQSDDARVAKAHVIFNRVLKAAGTRYGVIPRLFIIRENPFNVVLPISIPDGWIILSQQVLDMCFQNREQGDDRLAFVLSHEIAHLLDDDFWHMNFFSALSLLQKKRDVEQATVHEIENIFTDTAKVEAKELRADERGILFAAMAGYDPYAIVGESAQNQNSFFHEWHRLLDTTQFDSNPNGNTHPTSTQRSTAILARLQQVGEQADLFRMGLILYQTGKFDLAARAFGEFLRYFPSREVYHNLAVAHHQVALKYFQQKEESAEKHLLPFRLPVTADPYTRAAFGVFRGRTADHEKFQRHIKQAIKNYELAIDQDSRYILAYQNLASAYLINGEPYKAIATMQDVVDQHPDNATLLNALGVGFYLTGNIGKSRSYLKRAIHLRPSFDAPYYNLGKINYLEGDKQRAYESWQHFIELDPQNPWSLHLASNFGLRGPAKDNKTISRASLSRSMEQLVGVQVGNYLDEIPDKWGKPHSKQITVGDNTYSLLDYPNGVSVITERDEVRIIVANKRFTGKSGQGINIGSRRKGVLSNYGMPELRLRSTQGQNYLYPRDGISFQLAGDKVVSWSLY
ncbi:MAG: tetratricopeptide repeat protein [Gammaproteobacteria bacterium]|jgi:tetratricopeptide (TPR) repeat protein